MKIYLVQFIGYDSDDNHEQSRYFVKVKLEMRCKCVYLCASAFECENKGHHRKKNCVSFIHD